MIIPFLNRESLLRFIPNNKICAEIGVFNGSFSEIILKENKPSRLYLIDCWGPTKNILYNNVDISYQSIECGNQKYHEILHKFKNEILHNKVKIIRSFSEDCVDMFPDNFFDWIYLDSDHTYENVLNNLKLYNKKVKDNGLIIGHDYTNNYASKSMNFGVIEAVNEFVTENKYHLLVITLLDGFPSYIISKIYNDEIDEIVYNIINNSDICIEIDNFLKYKMYHEVFYSNNKGRLIIKIKEN